MSLVLAASNNGKELWYLTRGSGAVALLLLTASVLLGVANTTRWKTDRWPRFIVYGLHRNVTLLALAFTVVHVLTTIVDSFAPIGVVDAFIPFLSPYRPFWLGMGTVAFDLLLALIATSFLRRRIGTRAWRAVHWLAYASWPVALLHTFGTGSDARAGWMLFLGLGCGLSVLAAVMWRLLAARQADPIVRAGAMLATLGVLAGLVVWAGDGPLQHGWAARAGTPRTLLVRPSIRKAGADHRSSADAQAGDGARRGAANEALHQLPHRPYRRSANRAGARRGDDRRRRPRRLSWSIPHRAQGIPARRGRSSDDGQRRRPASDRRRDLVFGNRLGAPGDEHPQRRPHLEEPSAPTPDQPTAGRVESYRLDQRPSRPGLGRRRVRTRPAHARNRAGARCGRAAPARFGFLA